MTDFVYEFLQAGIDTIDQDLTAVFWTPDHMVLTGVHHIVVALIFHENHYATLRCLIQDLLFTGNKVWLISP